MRRVKVVSEATDLVPVLRSFDSKVKRQVFHHLMEDWVTEKGMEDAYGAEGAEALRFFDKTKLVETRWETVEGQTVKAYHSYYTAFNINTNAPVEEIAEVLSVAVMPDDEFKAVEDEILALTATQGLSTRAIAEKLDIPQVRLKSLIKRSSHLDLKGLQVAVLD